MVKLMLNTTYLLQYLEKKLGYKFNELEINSDDIINTVWSETLPEFSKFFPYQTRLLLQQKDAVNNSRNLYFLNTPYEIININRIITNDYVYSDTNPLTRVETMADPFTRQNVVDMYSSIRNPITWRFIYPNKVEIMPALVFIDNVLVMLNVVHPKHLGTIPINLQDEFLNLALLDVKDSLYQIRHRFSNLQTPYGSLELFIEDLQDAADKRKDLLENWRRNFYKQSNRKKIFIY